MARDPDSAGGLHAPGLAQHVCTPHPQPAVLELGPSCPQRVSQGVFFDTPLLAWYP